MRRLSLAFVMVAAAIGFWPGGHAGAEAPFKTGYWVQAQASQLPAALPPPPGPVIPDGGLYVANGPDGPKAISALAYEVGGEMSATMVLKVHSLAATPAPPSQAPAVAPAVIHLAACAAEGDWDPPAERLGKWEQRPAYDGDNCGSGQVSADGATVTFELIPERQQSLGVFNLVIIPDPMVPPESNTPFSVTFQPPSEDSLIEGDVVSEEEEEPEPVFDPAPTESDFDPGTFSEITDVVPEFSAAPLPVTTTPTTAAPRSRVVAPRPLQPVAAIPDDRAERIMAVSLLLALAVGWWWVGGQQARGPQLLGSLGAEGRRPARSAEPTGGIGRFARPRLAKPRPLI